MNRSGSAIPATNGSTSYTSKSKPAPDEKKLNLFRRILRRPKKTTTGTPQGAAGTIVTTPAEINEATAQLFMAIEDRYGWLFVVQPKFH